MEPKVIETVAKIFPGGTVPGYFARQIGRNPKKHPKTRTALTTIDTIDPRYGVMIFGAPQSHLDKIRAHMPLVTQVTCNVSRDYYIYAVTTGTHEGYEAWAVESILRAMRAGFDVLALLTGGNTDLVAANESEELVTRSLTIARTLKKNEVPLNAGKLIGFCFDLEWENNNFSHNGWRGYVDSVANALIELASQYPEIRRFGPGGTHSDDKTLPDLLTRLEQLGAFFTDITYHAYSDKGWKKWEKRAKALKRLFSEFGYDTLNITECGVTGEERWGDSYRGESDDLHYKRWGDLKGRLDAMPHIGLRQIYQITEAGTVEDHGQDFGMFHNDMTPKESTGYWK